MSKAMARPKKRPTLNTQDAILSRLDEAAGWIQAHTRTFTIGLVVVIGLVAAGFYYTRYRAGVEEQAAVQLAQLRLAAVSDNPDAVRTALQEYLTQFGATPEAAEARVLLADMELRRDSLGAAIAALEPVAEASVASPVGYAAASMLAAIYEQADRSEDAIRILGAVAEGAPFEFQRRRALSEQARLLAEQERYGEAADILARLVASSGADAGDEFDALRERLGEVRARAAAGAG
ncbi:MAG: tetratricopeptide repeat protein [Gemmatimonadota bacterium]